MVRVLLLIPSRTYRTHDFMTAASRLEVEVVVGSEHRPALAGLMEGRHLRLDFGKVEDSTQRIVAFAQMHPLAAIVAVDDAGTLLAATAARALGLPHNPVDAVEAARDKARMRQRFADEGLLTPDFTTAAIDTNPETIAASVAYPCVIKPLHLSGSQGVVKADGPVDFASVFARVAASAGEPDRAIAALQKLLSIPSAGLVGLVSPLTPALLRLDSMFDPLRKDPRFQKLCEEKKP